MAKTEQLDAKQLLAEIATGIKKAALSPNILSYKPHPKQELFHSVTTRGRLFLGGNRSGKTVGGATEAVWWLTGQHPYQKTPPPPVRGRCVSVDFINGVEKIVRPEIAKWLPPSALKGGSWYDAYDKQLRILHLENGSFLEFMSYDQDLDKFAGTSRHFTWFDEEPPRPIFNECGARLVDVGGRWWITMTPVEGMTWVFDELYEKRGYIVDGNNKIHRRNPEDVEGGVDINYDYFVIEVDMGENPHLNVGEQEAFLSTLDEKERKARERGSFVRMTGLIYPNFGRKNLIEAGWVPPKNWLWFGAMDHGLNNPTAWLFNAVDPAGNFYVFDEHYKSGEVVEHHARHVISWQKRHQRGLDYSVGDPSIRQRNAVTGTTVQMEYQDYGVIIVPGNNDVLAGINRVKRYLGKELPNETLRKKLIESGRIDPPKLFITRNCEKTIWEMRRYAWAKWSTKKMEYERNLKEEPNKKDDHAMDALRYGIASRPEMDVGVHIPREKNSRGASIAGPGYGEPLRDTGFDQQFQNPEEKADFHLGDDW